MTGDAGWHPGMPSAWSPLGTADVAAAVAPLFGWADSLPLVQAVMMLTSTKVRRKTARRPHMTQFSGGTSLQAKRPGKIILEMSAHDLDLEVSGPSRGTCRLQVGGGSKADKPARWRRRLWLCVSIRRHL